MLKPFWVSWYVPREKHKLFEYHGPWWISGETGDGEKYTVCAAVMAKDDEDVGRIIADAFDAPAGAEFRFTEERDADWSPFNDRFQQDDWMRWPWPGEDGKPRP